MSSAPPIDRSRSNAFLISLIVIVASFEVLQFQLIGPVATFFENLSEDQATRASTWLTMGGVRLAQAICIVGIASRYTLTLAPAFRRSWSLNILLAGSALLYLAVVGGVVAQSRRGALEDGQVTALFLSVQSVLGPLAEEFFFRGVIFAAMRPHINVVAAATISSLLFASAHALGDVPAAMLIVPFVGSFFMSFIYDKGKSLTVCVGLHMVFNLIAIVATA